MSKSSSIFEALKNSETVRPRQCGMNALPFETSTDCPDAFFFVIVKPYSLRLPVATHCLVALHVRAVRRTGYSCLHYITLDSWHWVFLRARAPQHQGSMCKPYSLVVGGAKIKDSMEHGDPAPAPMPEANSAR